MYVVVFRYGTVFRADGESREVRADGGTLGEGETVILTHHHPGEERVSRAARVDDPHFFGGDDAVDAAFAVIGHTPLCPEGYDGGGEIFAAYPLQEGDHFFGRVLPQVGREEFTELHRVAHDTFGAEEKIGTMA